MEGVNTPQLLFCIQILKNYPTSKYGFLKTFATCEQWVHIYKTYCSLGCKTKILYLIVFLIQLSIFYFFFSLFVHSPSQICALLFLPLSFLSSPFLLSMLSTSIRLPYPHSFSPPSFFSASPSLFSTSLTLYSLSPSSASLAHFSHQIGPPPYHPKKSMNMDFLVVHGVSLLTSGFFFGGSRWIYWWVYRWC